MTKEYRIVCDRKEVRPDGTVKVRCAIPCQIGYSGLQYANLRRFTLEEIQHEFEIMKQLVNEFSINHESEQRKKEDGKDHIIIEQYNIRILCRDVTEWYEV